MTFFEMISIPVDPRARETVCSHIDHTHTAPSVRIYKPITIERGAHKKANRCRQSNKTAKNKGLKLEMVTGFFYF